MVKYVVEREVSFRKSSAGGSTCRPRAGFCIVIPGFLVMFSNLYSSAPLAVPHRAYGVDYVPSSEKILQCNQLQSCTNVRPKEPFPNDRKGHFDSRCLSMKKYTGRCYLELKLLVTNFIGIKSQCLCLPTLFGLLLVIHVKHESRFSTCEN